MKYDSNYFYEIILMKDSIFRVAEFDSDLRILKFKYGRANFKRIIRLS
jgi:hypothetical protein